VEANDWLARFHAGDRAVLEECYREHFGTVGRAIGRMASEADRETLIHEVFFRLLESPSLRQGFRGGSLGAWLATIARHHAIDFIRHHRRERLSGVETEPQFVDLSSKLEQKAEARLLIQQFRREHLPKQWVGVFETRFLQQLSQREAAAALGMPRTTLAYQELRIRRRLRRFLLCTEAS
jgi:RNA polymerase sigma-70 factor (ECF subfamily)